MTNARVILKITRLPGNPADADFSIESDLQIVFIRLILTICKYQTRFTAPVVLEIVVRVF